MIMVLKRRSDLVHKLEIVGDLLFGKGQVSYLYVEIVIHYDK